MFIAVSKTVGFDTKQQQEINNAFKSIDDRISNTNIDSYEETLSKKDISINGVTENYSCKIGDHQISLLFKIPAHNAESLSMSVQSMAKNYGMESTTTTGNTKLYYLTDHNITIINNGVASRVRALQFQTDTIRGGFIYFIDNSYIRIDDTTSAISWNKLDYDITKLTENYPMSNITIKLAREDNNYSEKYYYAKLSTNGNIRIMDSSDTPLYLAVTYIIP